MPSARLEIVSPSLRLAELQRLAFYCGFNSSGTRSTIANHLNSKLLSWKPAPPQSRVLSIDLGVRNLAYSLLTTEDERRERGAAANAAASVKKSARLHTWRRLALYPRAGVSTAESPNAEAAQDFSPAAISQVAVQLVQERLLPLQPTHVLIERQRFRSGGGAAVFEWTVRVNSLEAMLYAIFAHLRATGAWDGTVTPIEPRKVAPFVLEDKLAAQEVHGGRSPPKKKASDVKKLKIDLLGEMLSAGEINAANEDTRDMVAAYLHRWRSKSSRKKSPSPAADLLGSEKLDDLADSLLQGLAWLKWEQNRGMVKDQGDKASLSSFMG